MTGGDQAAGLRRWLEQSGPQSRSEAASETRVRLCVLGLPGPSQWQARRVQQRLAEWQEAGSRWVGDARCWEPVAVAADGAELAQLVRKERRWALWVGSHQDAFRDGYRVLQQIATNVGPRQLLALHPPSWSRKGLLANLEQAATSLDLRLVVLAR